MFDVNIIRRSCILLLEQFPNPNYWHKPLKSPEFDWARAWGFSTATCVANFVVSLNPVYVSVSVSPTAVTVLAFVCILCAHIGLFP